MSADVYLNLGGNTDNMFALNQGKLGLGRFLIYNTLFLKKGMGLV